MTKKTLYVTDLDGTLLNSSQQLSQYSKTAINRLIDKGIVFSVATARSIATALPILQDLHFNVPIILMNGVFIYSPMENKYLHTETIPAYQVGKIVEIMKNHSANCFVYGLRDKNSVVLNAYHNKLHSVLQEEFYLSRMVSSAKKFIETDNYSFDYEKDIVYFTTVDTYERTSVIYDQLQSIEGITAVLYKDIYSKDGWFLEISNANANKGNAVKRLKDIISADEIVAFGDNYNDIKMFENADYAYCVENAADDVKQASDEVIGQCKDDAVAHTLERIFTV